MAALLQQTQFEVERIGTRTSVANNDIARLMYYMKCVCTAIDCNHDPDIQRFTNHHNFAQLSINEQKALIVGCYTFSPDILHDKVFFHSDALCGDCLNEFYTISQVRHQFLAAESIIIAGRIRHVNKIMTYKMQWLQTYYFDPMERLTARFGSVLQEPALGPQQIYTAIVVRQPVQQRTNSESNAGAGLAIVCCIVVVLVVVVVIVATQFS